VILKEFKKFSLIGICYLSACSSSPTRFDYEKLGEREISPLPTHKLEPASGLFEGSFQAVKKPKWIHSGKDYVGFMADIGTNAP